MGIISKLNELIKLRFGCFLAKDLSCFLSLVCACDIEDKFVACFRKNYFGSYNLKGIKFDGLIDWLYEAREPVLLSGLFTNKKSGAERWDAISSICNMTSVDYRNYGLNSRDEFYKDLLLSYITFPLSNALRNYFFFLQKRDDVFKSKKFVTHCINEVVQSAVQISDLYADEGHELFSCVQLSKKVKHLLKEFDLSQITIWQPLIIMNPGVRVSEDVGVNYNESEQLYKL